MSTVTHHRPQGSPLAAGLADLTARILGLPEREQPEQAPQPAEPDAPTGDTARAVVPPRRAGDLLSELAFLDD